MLDEQPGVGLTDTVKQIPGVGRAAEQVQGLLIFFRLGPKQPQPNRGVALDEPAVPGDDGSVVGILDVTHGCPCE